jgi:hypothetical protein
MADTLRKRLDNPDTPCDDRLEFVDRAYFRACLRAELRCLFNARHDFDAELRSLSTKSGIEYSALSRVWLGKIFESGWHVLEDTHEALRHRPVSPNQLTGEIERAEQLLSSVLHRVQATPPVCY